MIRFIPALPANATILCLGAHCDDVEIGCGGTLVELRQERPDLRFFWVVLSGDAIREAETRAAAVALLGSAANVSLDIHGFRVSYFPYLGSEIKQVFDALRTRMEPDLIFSHFLGDRHQDHRLVAELTWNTFRNHAILEYEIPKYEGDLAQPGVYCPVSAATVDLKIKTLLQCFPSQRGHQWFDAEMFRGHMRLRGVECNSPSRHAEAFHARKLLL